MYLDGVGCWSESLGFSNLHDNNAAKLERYVYTYMHYAYIPPTVGAQCFVE